MLECLEDAKRCSRSGVDEVFFSVLKMRAMECRRLKVQWTDEFEKEEKTLNEMAESVRRAGRVLEEHSSHANEKARTLWMSMPAKARLWNAKRDCCAAEIHQDMLKRGVQCKGEGGDINETISNHLSFLDSDPEVVAVVEAHEVIANISQVVDCLLGGRSFSVKHVCKKGVCYFELWHQQQDDVEVIDPITSQNQRQRV